MKALTKEELIELINKQLPDGATVVGFSVMASDFFSLEEENGEMFTEITDSDRVDLGDEAPEATHYLSMV